MLPRSSNKEVGSHKSDVDVAMDAADLFFGADNTSLHVALGSNFCIRPQDCIFQDRFRTDATILSHDCASAQLRTRIDNCRFGYALGPVTRFDVTRPPVLVENCAMNFQILVSRTNIEPLSVIQNYAANLATFTNPPGYNWNK